MGLRRSDWDYTKAITLEEYRTLDLTRPVTDLPTGSWSDARRSTDALASKAVTEVLGYVPENVEPVDNLSIYPDCGTETAGRRHRFERRTTCLPCAIALTKAGRVKRARRRNPGESTPKDAA